MSTLYYLIGISFVIMEFEWIADPFGKTLRSLRRKELDAEFKGKRWSECSEEYKDSTIRSLILIIPILWMFLGLLTVQWSAFLTIIVFNVLVIAPLSKLTKGSNLYVALHWINSWVGLAFSVFVIVNHFHLNIDTTAAAQKIFNSLLELLSSNP